MARMMLTLFTALPLAALAMPAKAQSVADFYRGKTITMVVGTSPGGDYDLRMRMVAPPYRQVTSRATRPSSPRNMPGAGADAGRQLARQRGAARTAPSIAALIAEHGGASGDWCGRRRYDVRQFNWIGNTTDTPNVINAWHTTGINTIQDVMQRELVVGATGTASGSFSIPTRSTSWSAPSSRSSPAIRAATMSTWRWSAARSAAAARTRGHRGSRPGRSGCGKEGVHPGPGRREADPGAARHPDAAGSRQERSDRQVLTFISADTAISRPLVTSAGVPPERVEALRRAFDATMKDPAVPRRGRRNQKPTSAR